MNETINFCFFLYNHRDLSGLTKRAFGNHLGEHFLTKLKDGSPKSILHMFMEMSEDKKEIFLDQVKKEYNYKGKNSE